MGRCATARCAVRATRCTGLSGSFPLAQFCPWRLMKKTSVRVDAISSPLLEAGPREAAEAVVFMPSKPGSIADWTRPVANVGEFARAVTMDALRPLNLLPHVIWDANDPYISVEFAARQ